MKNILNALKENKWIHYFIIVVIGIILSIQLANIQIRDTHDGFLHLLRIIGVNKTLSIKQIPAIVIPDYCNTWGYSMTLFYPPFVTYIPLLFKLIAPSYSIALKIFGGFCIVLSGITMYSFVYDVTKKRSIALFSAILYLIAPYKLCNVYRRYAIGEFAALIFLPTLFKGLHNLINEDGKKHYYIGIAASMLIFSHTITTLYASIFSVIYILFYLKKLKNKEILLKIFINVVFTIAITMLFIFPMLEARKQANYTIFSDQVMRTTSYYAQKNSIELYQFFSDSDEEYAVSFLIGIPILILLISTIYTVRKVDKKYKDIYIIFLLFSFISAYMSTKYFPWKYMPNIFCKLQFPWRMMGFFNFFTAFICGINLYILLKLIKRQWARLALIVITMLLSIIYTLSLLAQYKTEDENIDEKYENIVLNLSQMSHLSVNRDYLPMNAIVLQHTYMVERENITYILEGQANIKNEEKDKLNLNMEIEDASKDTILELPYLFYPGYQAIIIENDNKTKIKTFESENGFVAIKLPKDIEKCKLEVKFETTTITKLSHIGSLISALLFAIYIYSENKEK